MSKLIKSSCVLALSLASSLAVSAEAGFYAGFGFGQSSNKACDDVPFSIDTIECKDSKTAWKGLAGYNFHSNLGVELGYSNIGQAFLSELGNVVPGSNPTSRYVNSVSIEGVAYSLALVGHLDFVNNFSGFAKVGMANWHADVEAVFEGVTFTDSDDGNDLMLGLGVAYTDYAHQIRLEWDRFTDALVDENDVDIISLTYTYSF